MIDKESFPIYHESDRHNDKLTDLWENIDFTDTVNCPTCGFDRCMVTYNSLASTGLVTCKNPDCNEQIEI